MPAFYRLISVHKVTRIVHKTDWKNTEGLKTSDIIHECKVLDSTDDNYYHWFETSEEKRD